MGEALYPEGHPYSWSTIGYVEDLDRVDVNDLKKFFLRWYGPNNAVLTIGGDFDQAQTLAWVEKYFGTIPRGPDVAMPDKPPTALEADRYNLVGRQRSPAAPLHRVPHRASLPRRRGAARCADVHAGYRPDLAALQEHGEEPAGGAGHRLARVRRISLPVRDPRLAQSSFGQDACGFAQDRPRFLGRVRGERRFGRRLGAGQDEYRLRHDLRLGERRREG